MTPKAARYAVVEQRGQVKLMDGSRPRVDRRDMLVRVHFACVCGTDAHLVNSKKPFPWREPGYPFRIGHEWVGSIEELGSEFPTVDAYGNSIREGDRVVAYPSTWAGGRCFCCRILLQPNLCLRPPFGRKLPPDMSDHGSVLVNPLDICKKDMQILGCWGYGPQQFGEALGVLSRNPQKYRLLITQRYPLERIQEALHAMANHQCMKALIEIV